MRNFTQECIDWIAFNPHVDFPMPPIAQLKAWEKASRRFGKVVSSVCDYNQGKHNNLYWRKKKRIAPYEKADKAHFAWKTQFYGKGE